jgi:hypothetical protein
MDAIAVFERIGPVALVRQPLTIGDVIIFQSGDQRVLHRIASMGGAGNDVVRGEQPISPDRVKSRLVAVLYTQGPEEPLVGSEAGLTSDNRNILWVDRWDERLFTRAAFDKPTPHSSMELYGKEVRKSHQVFQYPAYYVWNQVPNTNSMEPFLDTNTVVIFETVTDQVLKRQPLQIGDIVTWRDNDVGGLHRIIGANKTRDAFYIRGDNCSYGDYGQGHSLIPLKLIKDRVVALVYTRRQRKGD